MTKAQAFQHPDVKALRAAVHAIEAEWATAPRGMVAAIREQHRAALNAIRDRMAALAS